MAGDRGNHTHPAGGTKINEFILAPRRLLLSAVPLALLLVACSNSAGAGDEGVEPRTIAVSMTDEMRFEPDEIAATAGETVRFELTNEGQAVHEFLIGDEAAQAQFEEEMAGEGMEHETDAGVSVGSGHTETFEYTFGPRATELLAGCHEPGHYDGGMVATITITITVTD